MQAMQLASSTVSKILSEKRDAERVSSKFSASIYNDGNFQCHCIIRDVSKRGMKLETPPKTKLPEVFEVKTPAMAEIVTVRRIWQNRREVGLEFISIKLPN